MGTITGAGSAFSAVVLRGLRDRMLLWLSAGGRGIRVCPPHTPLHKQAATATVHFLKTILRIPLLPVFVFCGGAALPALRLEDHLRCGLQLRRRSAYYEGGQQRMVVTPADPGLTCPQFYSFPVTF